MKTTFETNKNVYSDGETYINEKILLYDNASFDEIEKRMEEYNIILDRKEILKMYKKIEDIDYLVEFYQEKYEKELDKLANSKTMFDDDCIYLYLMKIEKSSY